MTNRDIVTRSNGITASHTLAMSFPQVSKGEALGGLASSDALSGILWTSSSRGGVRRTSFCCCKTLGWPWLRKYSSEEGLSSISSSSYTRFRIKFLAAYARRFFSSSLNDTTVLIFFLHHQWDRNLWHSSLKQSVMNPLQALKAHL